MIHKFIIYVLDHFTLDLTLRLLALFSCLICESKLSGVLLVSAFLIRKKVWFSCQKSWPIQEGKANPNSYLSSGWIFIWPFGDVAHEEQNHTEWHLVIDLTKCTSGAFNLLQEQSYLTTVSETFPPLHLVMWPVKSFKSSVLELMIYKSCVVWPNKSLFLSWSSGL